MRFQTLVVFTDFSLAADAAIERAAQLATQQGAQLQLLYASARPDVRFANPQASVQQRARQLARRFSMAVTALPVAVGDVLSALVQAGEKADVLVLAPQTLPAAPLWGLAGDALAQLMRRVACPVLLVQGQATQAAQAHTPSYAQAMIAQSGDSPALPLLLRCAHALQVGGRVQLFHADGPRDACTVVQDFQETQPGRLRVSDALDARRNRVDWRQGAAQDPVRQIVVQQERSGADLLVIAAPRPAWPWQGRRWLSGLVGAVGVDVLAIAAPLQGRTEAAHSVSSAQSAALVGGGFSRA